LDQILAASVAIAPTGVCNHSSRVLSFRNADEPLRNLLVCMQHFRCRRKADSSLRFGMTRLLDSQGQRVTALRVANIQMLDSRSGIPPNHQRIHKLEAEKLAQCF